MLMNYGKIDFAGPHGREQQPRRRSKDLISSAAKSLGLTQNQYDLLCLYAQGFSVKEIAKRQSRGLSTIYQSLNRIKVKLNLERDADLIAFAIDHGLRSKPPMFDD